MLHGGAPRAHPNVVTTFEHTLNNLPCRPYAGKDQYALVQLKRASASLLRQNSSMLRTSRNSGIGRSMRGATVPVAR